MNKRFVLLCLLTVAVCFVAIGLTNAQGRYSKSAFEKVMEDANKNTRILLGSLIAGDWAKIEASAEALAKDGESMRGLTPKIGTDRMVEFQAHADSVAVSAALIVALAPDRDRVRSAAALGDLVGACMDCHAGFRK